MALAKRAGKRLKKELAKGFDDDEGFRAAPVSEDNIMIWEGYVEGPEDTAWEGGFFGVRIQFPPSYPMKPPSVVFDPPITHPNVGIKDGKICLDILKSEWKPVLSVNSLLVSLRSLLAEPNPTSPLNVGLAETFVKDRQGYEAIIKQCVKNSWIAYEKRLADLSEPSTSEPDGPLLAYE